MAGPEGSFQINANGKFERWVLSICATLIAGFFVAAVALAVQVGQIGNDMGWVKEALKDLQSDGHNLEARINRLERKHGGTP